MKRSFELPTRHKKVRFPIGLVKPNPFAGPIQWGEAGIFKTEAPRKGLFRGYRGGPPRRLDTSSKYHWSRLPVRVANGVPEMPYGYWKIAQLIPDFGPQFLVAMDLQDWTDEHMRLFASDDEEFRKAYSENDMRSLRKEMREAEKMRREGKMSDDEFIDGGWELGGEEGKRGVIWKPPAGPAKGKKAKAAPLR